MFDIGWTEMLMVAVVAILVVGPKDLPGMLRTFGKSMKKIRALAGDFQKQFDDALKEAELDGIKDTVNDVRSLDPTKAIKDKLNPLASELEEVKKSVKADTDFDPKELFDESKAPGGPKPQKTDVDEALERQRKIDEEFAKVAPSSGANAVPGFGGPAADPLPKEAKPAAQKSPPTKSAAGKTAVKKTAAKKTTVKKTTAKKTTAKKTSAKKPAAKPAKTAPKAKTTKSKTAKPAPKANA